jgi:serine/threonine-protein kinase RsbW
MEKEIVISSKTENLRVVEKLVDEISSRHNLNTEMYGNLLISFIEAVNNAISHGNKLNPEKNVRIKVIIDEGVLKIITTDEGIGFDFNNVPDPTAPENIEKVSGRGIFLMRQLADEVEFLDEGRTSVLTFNL